MIDRAAARRDESDALQRIQDCGALEAEFLERIRREDARAMDRCAGRGVFFEDGHAEPARGQEFRGKQAAGACPHDCHVKHEQVRGTRAACAGALVRTSVRI